MAPSQSGFECWVYDASSSSSRKEATFRPKSLTETQLFPVSTGSIIVPDNMQASWPMESILRASWTSQPGQQYMSSFR